MFTIVAMVACWGCVVDRHLQLLFQEL